MKMKAAVMRAPFEPVTIEEVDIGEPGPREILIKTGASGVCHSDLHYVDGLYKHKLPTILGHEAAGTVEKVGSLVTYHQPGDRVITCLSVFCGTCDKCIRGEMVNCRGIGLKRAPSEPPRLHKGDEVIHQAMSLSSFAEYMLVHENAAVVVEEDVPIEVQALIGCGVTTGVGAAMRTARVIPGSTVAVVGCGGVGLSAINGAIIAGAARVIAIDAVEDKLGFAQRVGATDVIDASKGGVVEKVKKLTGGRGVDYSFEAIGKAVTAEQCFDMLDAGGTATIIGMIPQGTKITIDGPSMLDGRRIQGSNMGSNHFRVDMPQYMELYRQGRLKLDEIISKRIKLEDINEAFADMRDAHIARSVIMFN